MTFAECISIARDIIVSFAAVVTAVVAVRGVNNWKSQLQHKVHLDVAKEHRDVARKLLQAVYKVKEGIGSCRNRFIFSGEFPSGYNPSADSNETGYWPAKANAHAHIYSNRMQPVWKACSELHVFVSEARILWGDEVCKKENNILACVQDLRLAQQAIVDNYTEHGQPFAANTNWEVENRSVANGSSDVETDAFAKRVQTAVDEIERYVRPYLDLTRNA